MKKRQLKKNIKAVYIIFNEKIKYIRNCFISSQELNKAYSRHETNMQEHKK